MAEGASLTPKRKTRVIFDPDDPALGQGVWGGWRWFGRVAPLAAKSRGENSPTSSKVHLWANGAWTLAPQQFDLGRWGVTDPGVILSPGSGLTAVDYTLHKYNTNRTYDIFWRKKTTTGGNWASLSAPTSVTSLNTALGGIKNLRPAAKSASALPANQPLCLRFHVYGRGADTYDYLGAMIFGQYALVLKGTGMAELWEYGTVVGAGSPSWVRADRFRFARASEVSDRYHCLTILPMTGVSGEKWIVINGVVLDTNEQGTTGTASTPGGTGAEAGSVQTGEYPFRWHEGRTGIPDQSGGSAYVTISSTLWVLEREDLRCLWQVSRVKFESSGYLLSDFHASDPTDTRTWSLGYVGYTALGYTLTPTFRNAAGTSITSSSGATSFYVRWDMASSDGASSPILWGYKVEKTATSTTLTPGAFTVSEKISGGTVDASGANGFLIGPFGADPRQEAASFHVEDFADNWPRLRKRSKLGVKIVTKADDGTTDVCLFKGYAKPHRTKKGHANRKSGAFIGGSTPSYPSPEWSVYQIEAVGMWQRLAQVTLRTSLAFENFAVDILSSSTSGLQGWRVTEAIKYLLSIAGFPASMQDIPSLSIRLNAGIGVAESDKILEPSTNVAEMIVRLARNYLGRFLVFDANAGTYGKWRLVGAPTSTSPLATFVGGNLAPVAGVVKPQAHLPSYGGSVPLLSKPDSYFEEPECNHLWAFTLADAFNTGGFRVDNHLYNYLSYKVPGSTVNPDPDSPHYCPEGEKLFVVADPTLWTGGSATWQATQAAVNFCAFRLFFYLCMAREVLTFKAPLCFVTDPVTGNKRPPRHYDPVSYGGKTWFVRTMAIDYQHDSAQLADYELVRLVEYKPNP